MQLTSRPHGSDDGFGLVEVVVAVLVLGGVALAALPVVVTGVRAVAEAHETGRLVTAAENQLELARVSVCAQGGPAAATAPDGVVLRTEVTAGSCTASTLRVEVTASPAPGTASSAPVHLTTLLVP